MLTDLVFVLYPENKSIIVIPNILWILVYWPCYPQREYSWPIGYKSIDV